MITAEPRRTPLGLGSLRTLRSPVARLYAAPLSVVLCWIGLFTVSWDRLANVVVAGYNVKLPVIAFFGSLAISVAERPPRPTSRKVRVVAYLIATLLVVYGAAVVVGIDRHAGVGQFFTVLLGAVIPALAIERVARVHGDVVTLLNAFIAGGVVAALFGLYQLAATYAGLPQIVEYAAQGGDVGRISSFAYESAYFGYFLILVLAAIAARDLVDPRPRSLFPLLAVLAALALCNSRAVFFTLPVFVLLSAGSGHVGLRRLGRPALAIPLVLIAVLGLLYRPSAGDFVQGRLESVFDAQEETSNAPRLEGYTASFDIIGDHPFGIGPGSLQAVGPDYGLVYGADVPANRVVSNNIWIQSMLDGGVLLTLAQFALIAAVVLMLWRRMIPAARLLIAGWLTIVIVGGMLTSFFYDVRLWAALGLALSLATVTSIQPTPARRAGARGAGDG